VTAQEPAYREAFAELAARRPLSEIEQRIVDAFDRLAAGKSAVTDGALTVSNLCVEAGVSRASYYRSPIAGAVKDILASGQLVRPEIDILREQVTQLKKTEARLRSNHAAEVRELNATVAAYANQIQLLALRNAELETDNARLRALAASRNGQVIPLR
jgi:hypothetical protein